MRFWVELKYLLIKEFWIEWKQKFTIQSLILYAFSMTFVASIAFKGKIPLHAWNALFWILELFLAINAVAKSFGGEQDGQSLWMYSISGPSAVIFSKIIYNVFFLSLLSLITVLFLDYFLLFRYKIHLSFLVLCYWEVLD